MFRRRHSLSLVVLFTSAIAAAEPELVGDWADLSRLVVTGSRTFTAKQLRDKLVEDLSVLRAAHPGQPLDRLVPVLQERLLAGFHAGGFLDAQVSGELQRDRKQIELRVAEGQRWTCGAVRVTGHVPPTGLTADKLIAAVTESFLRPEAVQPRFIPGPRGPVIAEWLDKNGESVKLDDPLWKPGEPASGTDGAREALRRRLTSAAANLGYLDAKLDARVVRGEPGVADLEIVVDDPGQPAVVSQVVVTGLSRNTREELLAFLKLRPNAVWTRGERVHVEQQLWECGRFARYELRPETYRVANGTRAKLHLDVTETVGVPPLHAPLSREAETVLQARRSLSQSARDEDLIVSVEDTEWAGELVASARDGVVIVARKRASPDQPVFAVELARQGYGHFDFAAGRKFVRPASDLHGFLRLQFDYRPADEHNWRFQISAGVSSDADAPPTQIQVHFTPSGALALAYDERCRRSWHGSILTVQHVNADKTGISTLKFDGRTGRLLEVVLDDDVDGKRHLSRLSFRRGEFARRLREIESRAQAIPNACDAKRPATSLVKYVIEDSAAQEWLRSFAKERGLSDEQSAAFVQGCRKLAAGLAVDSPLDTWLTKEEPEERERFFLPLLPDEPNGTGAMIGRALVAYADRLFERDSWPWIVCRQAGFVLNDSLGNLQLDAQRLFHTERYGPVSDLVAARLAGMVIPRLGATFSARGYNRTSAEVIEADLRPLFDRQYLAGQQMLRVAEALRELTVGEADALGTALVGPDGFFVAELVRGLRKRADLPIDKAVEAAISDTVKGGLEERIKSLLWLEFAKHNKETESE